MRNLCSKSLHYIVFKKKFSLVVYQEHLYTLYWNNSALSIYIHVTLLLDAIPEKYINEKSKHETCFFKKAYPFLSYSTSAIYIMCPSYAALYSMYLCCSPCSCHSPYRSSAMLEISITRWSNLLCIL